MLNLILPHQVTNNKYVFFPRELMLRILFTQILPVGFRHRTYHRKNPFSHRWLLNLFDHKTNSSSKFLSFRSSMIYGFSLGVCPTDFWSYLHFEEMLEFTFFFYSYLFYIPHTNYLLNSFGSLSSHVRKLLKGKVLDIFAKKRGCASRFIKLP